MQLLIRERCSQFSMLALIVKNETGTNPPDKKISYLYNMKAIES